MLDKRGYPLQQGTANSSWVLTSAIFFGTTDEAKRNRKKERDRLYQEKRRRENPNLKRWEGIKARCFNPKHKSYPDYGGRGITMHSLWVNNFKLFNKYLDDFLGRCPDGYTLDRIDNDGNYEPGNLRWADPRQQCFNKGRKIK